MKKTRFLSVILLLALVLSLVQVPGAAAEETASDVSVLSGCKTTDAQNALYGNEKKLETAKAAILYEVNSDTMLYSWNADDRLPPASLIKIVTCIVVLENCELDETVTVTGSAMAEISKGAATLKLTAGEQFTVEQLLYGMMVGSANDAAVVLAEHVSGSHAAFVAEMNRYVQELGCKDTFITNAHGLHDENQCTSARDLVRILKEAMKNEAFMEFFSADYYNFPGKTPDETRRVETTNYLATPGTPEYYEKTVTGGRTGITYDSKRSLIVTASKGELNYIAVVLSATTIYNEDSGTVKYFGSYEETKALLEMGLEDHQIRQVLYEGQVLNQLPVGNGRNVVSIGVPEACVVTLPNHITVDDLSVRYGSSVSSLSAPVEKGEQITTVEVWLDNVCIAHAPVIAMNSAAVDNGTMLQKNQFGGTSKVWVIVLIVVIVAVIVFVLGFLVVRATRSLRAANTRRRHRRRRNDRRRTR